MLQHVNLIHSHVDHHFAPMECEFFFLLFKEEFYFTDRGKQQWMEKEEKEENLQEYKEEVLWSIKRSLNYQLVL